MMNQLTKLTIVILLLFISAYYLYFYITPSVTVINKSENAITEVNIQLPQSNLSFGSIELGQKNTIHYSLSQQQDGSYRYSLKIGNKVTKGACGYLTNNEYNKRFIITVNKNNMLSCTQ